MGSYADNLDDHDVERKAFEICVEICVESGDTDPERMTYINDDGILQPYGPAWAWFIEDAIKALQKS